MRNHLFNKRLAVIAMATHPTPCAGGGNGILRGTRRGLTLAEGRLSMLCDSCHTTTEQPSHSNGTVATQLRDGCHTRGAGGGRPLASKREAGSGIESHDSKRMEKHKEKMKIYQKKNYLCTMKQATRPSTHASTDGLRLRRASSASRHDTYSIHRKT